MEAPQQYCQKTPSKSLKKAPKRSPMTTKRRPRTSPIWSYASQDPGQRITLNSKGQEVWICSLCTNKNTSYLLSGGTAAPIRHLLRVHHVHIPPSNSKNRRKTKSKPAVEVAAAATTTTTSTSTSESLSKQESSTFSTQQKLLPAPVIKTESSNNTDALSETISQSITNKNTNVSDLASLDLSNVDMDDSSNSDLFDILMKVGDPSLATLSSKIKSFGSYSSVIDRETAAPAVAPSRPTDSPTSPVSELNSSLSQIFFSQTKNNNNFSIDGHNDQFNYDCFPITPRASSSTTASLSTPSTALFNNELTFNLNSGVNNNDNNINTIFSNSNASSNGWYYPELDSPITPLSPLSPIPSSASTDLSYSSSSTDLSSSSVALSNTLFDSNNNTTNNLNSNLSFSLFGCVDVSLDQLFDSSQPFMGFYTDKLPLDSVDSIDSLSPLDNISSLDQTDIIYDGTDSFGVFDY